MFNRVELKKTIALAIPIVLGQLGQVAFGIMDNAMVGRLGTLELASAGFALTVTIMPFLFLIGVGTAISVMVAQAFGSERFDDCGSYMLSGIYLLLGLLASLMTFYLFGPDFLSWFSQPADVVQTARPYFALIAWSLLPMVLFQGLRQFSVGLEKAMWPTAILFMALGINFVLNLALIFGYFGAPKMGLVGAGWATLISRLWMVLALFLLIYKSKDFARYRPTSWKIKSRHFRPVCKIGLASGLLYLFEGGSFAAAGIMAGWVSTAAIAAHQIALNVGSFTFMFAWGICFATSVRVSQAHGRYDTEGARARGVSGMVLVAMVMAGFGVIIVTCRNMIPAFYTPDPEVIKIAASLLVICAIFQVCDGIQAVAIGALRGASDTVIPAISTAFIYWGVAIPTSYALAFKLGLGVDGLWWGLTAGLTIASVTMGGRFIYKTRHKI